MIKNNLESLSKIESKIVYQSKYDPSLILLTIAIPTYNRKDLLIESFKSAVKSANGRKNIEILVLSNDSNEQFLFLLNLIEDSNVIFMANSTNIGMCNNLNKCVLEANGKYVSFLHDDDLIDESYCKNVSKLLLFDNDCIIGKRYLLFPDNEWGKNKIKKQAIKERINSFFFFKNFCKRGFIAKQKDIIKTARNCFGAPTCGTLFKKRSFIQAGGFDPNWKYAFDFVFFADFVNKYKIRVSRDVFGSYRMFDSATNNALVQLEFFEAYDFILSKIVERFKIKNKKYLLKILFDGLSFEAQKEILAKHPFCFNNLNGTALRFLKLKAWIYSFRKGFYLDKRPVSKGKEL